LFLIVAVIEESGKDSLVLERRPMTRPHCNHCRPGREESLVMILCYNATTGKVPDGQYCSGG